MCENILVFNHDKLYLQRFFQVGEGSTASDLPLSLFVHSYGRSSLPNDELEYKGGRVGQFYHPNGYSVL